MADIRMTIYDPPLPGLPYLAVMLMPDGPVRAVPCNTFAEAEAYVISQAEHAARVEVLSREDPNA